jgi:hypothetical protein
VEVYVSRPRRLIRSIVAFALATVTPAGARAQTTASVESVLESAADYLDRYSSRFSAVVSEEKYQQIATEGRVRAYRVLRSDMMLLNGGDAGWLGFRDVFAVDGKPVRDRDDRVLQLFLHPSGRAVEQATRILDEGARFNVGAVHRTINVPTMALPFLRRENQARSAFDLGDEVTIDGVRTRILRFKEQALPRLIYTSDDAPAMGRFWVEVGTGRVVRTELLIDSEDAHGAVTVTYREQPQLDGLWVPARMEEHYSVGALRSIDCEATYSNFRQFHVDVATKIIK